MKHVFVFWIIFQSAFAGISWAQTDDVDSTQVNLPKSWIGSWTGTLEIWNASGKTQEVAMELHIYPQANSKRWQWTIIYGEDDQRQERTYELLAINSSKGQYQIDEKNSIFLEANFINETMISRFEVQNNLITTTYRLQGENLIFEILVGPGNKPNKTGGKQDSPPVHTYPIRAIQKAILKPRRD